MIIKNMIIALIASVGINGIVVCDYSTAMEIEKNQQEAPQERVKNAIDCYKERLPKLQIKERAEDSISSFLQDFAQCRKGKELTGHKDLTKKIKELIDRQETIHFVIVGFPFKSTNSETKVLSSKVDLAEYVGLFTLNFITEQIESIYKPGAKISIISDGLAFIDVLDAKESQEAYKHDMNNLIKFFPNIDMIHPDTCEMGNTEMKINGSAYPLTDSQEETKEETEEETEEKTKEETKKDIRIFMTEEVNCKEWNKKIAPETGGQKDNLTLKELKRQENQHNKMRKERIKIKIDEITNAASSRSGAFGAFVKNYCAQSVGLKHAIRLSVHPHLNIGNKLGVSLVYGSRGTPWHQICVIEGEKINLRYKKDLPKEVNSKIDKYITEYKIHKENDSMSLCFIDLDK